MSKPLGVNAAFQLTRPSKTEDAIYEAVRTAISEGWTPREFNLECADAWGESLRDEARHADSEWGRIIEGDSR